jgi:FkbM family methyltransferase
MKISIITPSFNQAKFITRTIESVAKQTFNDWEHIVFDGGSTDGSDEILSEYADSDNRVSFIYEPDRGQAHAINKGFAKAKGKVLTWLNSDDYYCDAGVLEAVAEYFSKHSEVDVMYGRGFRVDTDGNKLKEAYIQPNGTDFLYALQHSLGLLQPAVFFRKEIYESAGGLNEEYNLQLDYEFWIRIAKQGFRFGYLDRILCNAVVHDAAKSTGQRQQQLNECLYLVKKKYGYVPIQWISRYAEFFVSGKDRKVISKLHLTQQQKDDSKIIERFLLKRFNTSKDAKKIITLNRHMKPYSETIKSLSKNNLDKNRPRQIVVTSFDSCYYQQGLNLIASLHRTSLSSIDKILVYSLELTTSERKRLEAIEKVEVIDYPEEAKNFFPQYLQPKTRAYKPFAIRSDNSHVSDGDIVLWMDAGLTAFRSVKEIFDLVIKHEFFITDHDDKPSWPFYNVNFTHPKCIEVVNPSNRELLAHHLCSCIVGYLRGGRFQKIIEEAYIIGQKKEAVLWPKVLSKSEKLPFKLTPNQKKLKKRLISGSISANSISRDQLLALFPYYGHRTQSIYSILAYRYDAPYFSAKIYHRSNEQSSKAAKVNWESSAKDTDKASKRKNIDNQDPNVVIYHHRGIYHNLEGMRYKRKGDHIFVLGNGPSLSNFDFKELRGHATIGMNAAYRFWDKTGFYPTYYCCFDPIVLKSHREQVFRLIKKQSKNGINKFFLRENFLKFYPELHDHPNVFFLERIRQDVEWFNKDKITTGSFSTLVAWFLGYRWIYLLGIDLNYKEMIPEATFINEKILKIKTDPKINPNYFFSEYQKKGDLYNPPNRSPDLHLRSWKQLKEFSNGFPWTIINLNRTSALKIFPFDKFENVKRQLNLKFVDVEHEVNKTIQVNREQEFWRNSILSELVRNQKLIGPYQRDSAIRFNENKAIHALFSKYLSGEVMIDVGAHHGSALMPFLNMNWHIYAIEPDDRNRGELLRRLSNHRYGFKVQIDSRAVSNNSSQGVNLYCSDISSGISSLRKFHPTHKCYQTTNVTTLSEFFKENDISKVDFLKIDTEGHDLLVLQGFPWEQFKPKVIMCEFEDTKTVPLGYTFHDMARFLVDKGYQLYVSEWHPIVSYGIPHGWKCLMRYPCQPTDEKGWGNLIAFRDSIDETKFLEAINSQLKGVKTLAKAKQGLKRFYLMFANYIRNNCPTIHLIGSFAVWSIHFLKRQLRGLGGIMFLSIAGFFMAAYFFDNFRWLFISGGVGISLLLVGGICVAYVRHLYKGIKENQRNEIKFQVRQAVEDSQARLDNEFKSEFKKLHQEINQMVKKSVQQTNEDIEVLGKQFDKKLGDLNNKSERK